MSLENIMLGQGDVAEWLPACPACMGPEIHFPSPGQTEYYIQCKKTVAKANTV